MRTMRQTQAKTVPSNVQFATIRGFAQPQRRTFTVYGSASDIRGGLMDGARHRGHGIHRIGICADGKARGEGAPGFAGRDRDLRQSMVNRCDRSSLVKRIQLSIPDDADYFANNIREEGQRDVPADGIFVGPEAPSQRVAVGGTSLLLCGSEIPSQGGNILEPIQVCR